MIGDRFRTEMQKPQSYFYKKTSFPNYDDFDDTGSLITKARKGIFCLIIG